LPAAPRRAGRFLHALAQAAISILSIVARPERNIAINQEHPEFKRIRAAASRPVIWDQRLFRLERKLT